MVGKHLAQRMIDFVAGVPRRQRRLRAGDLLAHPREVREVIISGSAVAAVLRAAGLPVPARHDDILAPEYVPA